MRENSLIVTASENQRWLFTFGAARDIRGPMTDPANAVAEARLLSEVKSACELHPEMQITVDMAASDDLARKHGWSESQAMREGVQRVLKGLPPDMAKRISVKTRSE